jgi:hypothetical protein
LPKE